MLKFAGINFDLLQKKDILESNIDTLFVVTANAEIISKINEDVVFRNNIQKAHFTFDGQIPFLLAKLKTKRKDFIKISGSDLIYDICQKAQDTNKSVFLLGGQEESNYQAQEKLKIKYPGLSINGFSPPFSAYPFSSNLQDEIFAKILSAKPNYLFVGFGAGKQEAFISDNFEKLRQLKIEVVVGSGGTFEFVSGKIKRAPIFIQKIGLEGLFRLIVEPKFFRVKRLLISFKIFLYYFKN